MADSLTRSRLAQADLEVDPTNRQSILRRVMSRWQQFPGSAPMGSGLTGLGSADARGWSRMQNENTWALNTLRDLQNKAPLRVESGGTIREFHEPATAAIGGEGPGYATGVSGVSSQPVIGGPQSSMSLAALRALLEAQERATLRARRKATQEGGE